MLDIIRNKSLSAIAFALAASVAMPEVAFAQMAQAEEADEADEGDEDRPSKKSRRSQIKAKKAKAAAAKRRAAARRRAAAKRRAEAELCKNEEAAPVAQTPTPEQKLQEALAKAESRRGQVQQRAEMYIKQGDAKAAVQELSFGGVQHHDPILLLDAATASFKMTDSVRRHKEKKEVLKQSMEQSQMAKTMLESIDDPLANPEVQVVDPEKVPDLVSRSDVQLRLAQQQADVLDEERQAKSMLGAGGAMLAMGAGGMVVMAAGLVMEQRREVVLQEVANRPDLAGADLTAIEERGRLNTQLSTAGAVVGGAGLAVGVIVMAVGGTKLKKAKKERERVAAQISPGIGSLTVSGKF